MDQGIHVGHGHGLRSCDQTTHTSVVTENNSTAVSPQISKNIHIALRSSTRVSKKVKLDLTPTVNVPPPAKSKKEDEEHKLGNNEVQDAKRPRRNWGQWTVEDKNTFFEALNESGKDFDAIQGYFAAKMKKKGLTDIKNKDQIRHFYYRNWNKVSKFLQFSPELKKVTQELYTLINYGELRKRMGRAKFDKNTIYKLQELIYHGYTLLKIKGKTVRVKTPLCRALRKLNQFERDDAESPKLPQRVVVELRPVNNEAWSHVHSLAQNPRARTSLPLQYKLQSLISFLQHRWRPRDIRLFEKFVPVEDGKGVDIKRNITVRLAPKAGSQISLPQIIANENLTSTSLSLQTYEERFLGSETVPGKKNNCSKRSKKKANCEKKEEGHEIENEDNGHNILSLQLEGDDATDGDLRTSPQPVDATDESKNKAVERIAEREAQIAKIKAGWTISDYSTLTIGELYIMFGNNGKLLLEYTFEGEIKQEDSQNNVTVGVNKLLQKIVSLSKLLPVLKDKPSCPCGHICNKAKNQNGRRKNAKPNATVTSTISTNTSTTVDTHIVVQSPSYTQPLQDGVFRRPIIVPSQFKAHTTSEEAFKAQLDQFRPKYCNRRGRSGRKNVVVQRMLPLLPKTANGASMLTVNVLPSTGEYIRPLSTQTANARVLSFTSMPVVNTAPNLVMPTVVHPTPITPKPVEKPSSTIQSTNEQPSKLPPIPAPSLLPEPTSVQPSLPIHDPSPPLPPSPPASISSLLNLVPDDISLGSDPSPLLDVPLNNNPSNFMGLLVGDENCVDDSVPDPCSLLQSSGSTPPISPTRILKETDNQWLNSEVVDFSFSSFLSHLDSPLKGTSSTNNDDTRLSQDVDAQLQCLMSESSVDYVAKFADLAAHLTNDSLNKK